MSGVHPSAFIGDGVELGEGVVVGPFAVVAGPCRIGDRTWVGPNAVIGTPGESRGMALPAFDGTPFGLGIEIGADSVIREFVTVHQGIEQVTRIGEDCYVMAYGHVPHDATLGNGVTVSDAAQIGGHSWIGDGANLGLGAVLHQRSVVGAYAMVGMQSAVTRPIPPFAMAMGVPARVVGANRVALQRLGLAPEDVDDWHARLRAGEVVGEGSSVAVHVERYVDALAAVQPKGHDRP